MAGMLPGVEMHRRIRAVSQRLHKDGICFAHRHHQFYRSSAEPPLPLSVGPGDRAGAGANGGGAMDEAALRARRRLEEKLGYFRHSSRQTRVQANEGRGARQAPRAKDSSSHLVGKILLRSLWKLRSNKSNSSKGDVCAVCLEDFGAEQQVMELNCTHKYHSKCLVPWLASHPNCPSCRTPVGP